MWTKKCGANIRVKEAQKQLTGLNANECRVRVKMLKDIREQVMKTEEKRTSAIRPECEGRIGWPDQRCCWTAD
jgi:ABC-type phosphate transport system auxiliary subunit